MSLFKCPGCKKKISVEAVSCPKCGRPVTAEDREKEKEANKPAGCLTWIVTAVLCLAVAFWFIDSKHDATRINPTRQALIDSFNSGEHGRLDFRFMGGDGKVSISLYSSKKLSPKNEMMLAQGLAMQAAKNLLGLDVQHEDITIYARVYSPAGKNAAGEQLWTHNGVADYSDGNISWRTE